MMYGGRSGRCRGGIIHSFGKTQGGSLANTEGTVSICLFLMLATAAEDLNEEDVNLLSAVRLAGPGALVPRGAAEFQESGNNQSAKVSNHLNSSLSSLEL